MKNRLNGLTISILSFCIFSGLANIANAEDPVEIQPYLRKSTSFKFETLGKEIPVKIYYITGGTHSRPWDIGSPVIVYVKNHGYERIGREPDLSILMHYLKQRYIVITIDFANDPKAVSPHFDKDLHELFKAIYANDETSLLGTRLAPRKYRCFFLPAGCRVATDLVFWELDKHGANGTLEYIMDFYNEHIAGVVTGKEKVTSPNHLTDRQGRPFQYKLAMDIVYPSKAKKKVSLVFYLSTQVTRHPNVAPKTYRPHMMGFTMRGYAYAIIDHCYNPIRRHFWFTPGRFSLDRWNGLACYSAAIRFIRAHAEEYNVDARHIGGMGHSKGQYSITRLSDLGHEDKEESRQFEGHPPGSPEPQPWQGYSSRISVGYQSPGNHAESITPEYAPTLVSHGAKDSMGRGYRTFFERLEEFDINHVALLMRGLGHELPYGYDEELGVDRYALVHEFFDQYLKVEEKLAPVVLFTVPRDQATDVAPSETISIQFAPVMDEESIVDGRGVKIVGGDGSPVKGSWSKSRQSTRFTFTAKEDFREGEKYNVIITTHVKNEVGTHLDEARIVEFTIGKNAVTAETSAAKKPAIVESIILPVPKTFSWDSPLLGKPISCAVRLPDSDAEKNPVVVYMKNLPAPRLGELDDETLIKGFLDQGMMVIEVDYEGDQRAAAPELLPEIDRWYGYLFETEDHPVDTDWIYILPAGYTIDRKIEICEMKGRLVGMDVIYPSGQTDPVPLMLQVTSTKERGKWINQRAYYIYGLLTTGYAGAIMDWNGTGPGAAPGGDVFPEKRAARLLRARAGDWNLSGRLGVTGHSKGSGRAGKAAFINEGNWEADRGPYADQSDRFQVALLSAGQHAPEFLIEDGFHKPVRQSKDELTRVSSLTYVTPDDPPVFLSVGELDREFRVKQMKRVAARCDEVGVTYRLFVQKGMGHMYNPRPEVISHIYSFLDWHLKPESRAGTSLPSQAELDRLADEVLVVTPSSPSDETSTDAATKNESPDVAIIAAPEKPVAKVEAGDPPELQPYLRQSTMWHCAKLEKDVPLNVYFADKRSTSPQQAPVIVYVKGLAAELAGQESDLAILSDYIEQRYIVITVDYGGDARAVSPAIDQDLHAILGAIYGTGRNTLRRGVRTEESPLLGDLGLEPAYARCFFLPAGYRVATDLVFWEVDKHGSRGTMKRVVRAYNEQVVDEKGRHHIPGRSPISSPDELIDRDGAPLDCKLRMDIIYPSQADKKVPLIFWISTTTIRAPSSNPSGYRPHMLGFPMRGYAYAIIDHCYNPVALRYGHYKGHALSNINGLKAYTAAIRFLRAHAGAYNVDPRYIGGWGHSKGAYALTRLSDPNHAERGVERQRLEGEPEGSPEPQPWPGYSSRIAAGYQSMGNGTRWSAQYVTADYAPTLVACGELDHFNHWLDWPRVVDAYERTNANHVALGMLGLGHELPYGRDEELGEDRYELVMSFFDRYLKVEEKLAPVVLFTTPRDQETDVEPSATISVQFAPVMDEASIVDGRGVKIIKGRDGSPVKGFWTSSRKGARFTFTPKEDFRAGEKYKVIVTTHVKNEAGTPLDEAGVAEFTVGKMAIETKTSAAKKPAIVALESIGAVVEVDGTGSEQFAVKVDLRSGKVTDVELEHVKQLTRLRELRLDGIPITDDGLKYLQEMTNLQRLDLPNTRITDNGLSYLRELKNLSALSIKGNRVTDAGLKHLQGLTNLEMLSLGPNQISDIGVKSLRDLTKLRYLNLMDTQVTDSVFEYLKPLTNLRTLRLRGTRVTEKGVQDMKQRLPDCSVSR